MNLASHRVWRLSRNYFEACMGLKKVPLVVWKVSLLAQSAWVQASHPPPESLTKLANNQRLRGGGDNDWRSNTFALTLCFKQVSHDRWSRLRVIEGPNTSDQIAFYAFHSFLVDNNNSNNNNVCSHWAHFHPQCFLPWIKKWRKIRKISSLGDIL